MSLKTLLSLLLVYRSNFQVLHWMVKGKNFFTLHGKAEDFTNMISKDIDVVAEMALRMKDPNPIVNYAEALEVIEKDENHSFLLVESSKLYDTSDFCDYTLKMFNDILVVIESVLQSEMCNDIKNVGIKATLESMHNEYDLQLRYLLERFSD